MTRPERHSEEHCDGQDDTSEVPNISGNSIQTMTGENCTKVNKILLPNSGIDFTIIRNWAANAFFYLT